jgi:hypothetical protein
LQFLGLAVVEASRLSPWWMFGVAAVVYYVLHERALYAVPPAWWVVCAILAP